jgi:1-acyl-sn-glycerol-3-phosphate acyltransferase
VTNEEAHRLAREKGVSRPLYAVVRGAVTPLFRAYFRMRISGREHVPSEGAAIVAPNHKSFWDSFFIGIGVKRHLRFMAKTELIEARYGPLLVRLGAFPVRRGESDADALETARTILRQDGLRDPKRGAGRLALEFGAPLVPAAITGTERLFAGPFPKPRRVQVAFAPPIPVSELASSPEAAGEIVEGILWPTVEGEYRRLKAREGLLAGGIAALGVGGGLLVRQRRRRREQQARLPARIRRGGTRRRR